MEEPFQNFPPAVFLREFAENPGADLTHFEYFRLCLSSHYLTVATPTPTDVDNQIRLKLWPKQLPTETVLRMAQLTLESRNWDFSLVTRRLSHGLSGHLGEWFTVACGAYCGIAHYKDKRLAQCRQEIFQAIEEMTERHSEVFGRLMREKQGLECLKASAPIAHNFGDLDRVMDQWELEPFDPLRLKFYKLAIKPFDADGKLRHQGRLWVAGELYKSTIETSSMAMENHRHFALRKPRCLRSAPDLLIQTGPFLDDWGRRVASALKDRPEDLLEVTQALELGWSRLPGTLGYGRALRGIQEVAQVALSSKIPKDSEQQLAEKWNEAALFWIDEIPSKA